MHPLLTTFLTLLALAAARRCRLGKFDNGSTCVPCPPGTFGMDDGDRDPSCFNCRIGTYNPYPGALGREVCRNCPLNTTGTITGAASVTQCTPCPPGQYSSGSTFPCRICPPGSRTPPLPLTGTGECAPCPKGKYLSFGDCLDCPPGTSTLAEGARSLSACITCPPPLEFQSGKCESCSRGSFYDLSTRKCTRCPQGTFNAGFGCILCAVGKISSNGGCKDCPVGTSTRGTGASFCRRNGAPCPPGFFVTPNGDCLFCNEGSRLNVVTGRCEICPAGSASRGGTITKCTVCNRGELSLRDKCICGEGFFRKGQKCIKCRPGTFQNFDGAIRDENCVKCPRGTFAAKSGQSNCTKCPSGTVSEKKGSTRCSPCPRGLVIGSDRYRSVSASPICVIPATNCPPGFTRRLTIRETGKCVANSCPKKFFRLNSGECDTCEVGEGASNDGCKACASNQVSPGGDAKCKKCPKKFVRDAKNGKKCVCSGRLALGRGLKGGECRKCSPGTVNTGEDKGLAKCKPCPAGFIPDSNGFRCIDCQPNEFAPRQGMTTCLPCPPGTGSYGLGEAECFPL